MNLRVFIRQTLLENFNSVSDADKKYIDALLEYVYYNNPEEDDEFAPNAAPDWIITGSYHFLNNKGIATIYRGIKEGSYQGQDAYSWTYNKKVAEFFGDTILEKPLPQNVISPEFFFDWVNKTGYIPEYATASFMEYIQTFDGGEQEVIIAN